MTLGEAGWAGARLVCGGVDAVVAALLSKTVTCSLPAALLLAGWWQRGRVRRSDVLPLLPLFLVGLGLGLLTVWVERHYVGAQGTEWSLTPVERCLVAGRALWFYAGKLVWPAKLTFIYPRWEIDAAAWWQWLFPFAALGAVAALWFLRDRIGRGPLVAVLFFAGTLVPALGFVNVYPMRYSFVADHFQYLASVGLLVAGVAGLGAGLERIRGKRLYLGPALWATLLVVLGLLTWRQCGMYASLETLWQTTITRNPGCAMAYNNLGSDLLKKGRVEEAMAQFQKTLHSNSNTRRYHGA